jgi:hypothetical protein
VSNAAKSQKDKRISLILKANWNKSLSRVIAFDGSLSKGLNTFKELASYIGVKLVKPIMAAFLAVLWTVVGVHCQMEVLPGMEFFRCSASQPMASASDAHCSDDGCSAIEQGHYQGAPSVSIKAPVLVALFVSLLPHCVESIHEGSSSERLFAEAASPPIPWQFFSRAALLPRAPSFVS